MAAHSTQVYIHRALDPKAYSSALFFSADFTPAVLCLAWATFLSLPFSCYKRRSHCVAHPGFKFLILHPLPLKCLDYRCALFQAALQPQLSLKLLTVSKTWLCLLCHLKSLALLNLCDIVAVHLAFHSQAISLAQGCLSLNVNCLVAFSLAFLLRHASGMIYSLLRPYDSQGSNLGCQTWWQAPLIILLQYLFSCLLPLNYQSTLGKSVVLIPPIYH